MKVLLSSFGALYTQAKLPNLHIPHTLIMDQSSLFSVSTGVYSLNFLNILYQFSFLTTVELGWCHLVAQQDGVLPQRSLLSNSTWLPRDTCMHGAGLMGVQWSTSGI